jgi:hypothetical protein
MQFQIATGVKNVDVASVERALRAVDPAAIVDLADTSDQLRVSTFMSVFELIEAVDQAGYPVTHAQVRSVKSDCCGGCGG